MDYQIVFRHRPLMLWLILSSLHCAFAIVNRDIVLTPKQGLQLSGKRIFYDENDYMVEATLRNSSNSAAARPWERTLKHVAYLTLFTNAATNIITGNFSKVKEYNDFLQSPYIRSPNPNDSRFGDIVTLAQGRLESMTNGTYRFVEGNCDYECARENNMVASWHVQKIRHRDIDRKFHYEMKFSVSPMTTATPSETVVRGGPNKRTIMDSTQYKVAHNSIQTFIQREDDYPQSFSKILSPNKDDDDFAERRYDGSRNFRQVYQQHQQQATPMPQPTFLRGVYRPAPQPPPQSAQIAANSPFPENLNIGEYYKGNYGPKASPKIELFPNLLSMMFGKPHNFPQKPPSTYRPPTVYQQMKFPRPEIYAPIASPQNHPFVQRQEYTKLPEYYHSQEQFSSQEPQNNPVISHHYHHHFFMANSTNSAEIQSANSGEEQDVHQSAEVYKNAVQVVTPLPHFTHAYDIQQQQKHPDTAGGGTYALSQYHHQQLQHHQQFHKMPPAPQKFVFPIAEIEQHRVVHVTPVSPLRKPQYQQYYQHLPPAQYTTGRGPLVIYPAPVEDEKVDVATPRNKPFVQSQPMQEEEIRYSEPDPLYAQITEKQQDDDDYGTQQQEHGVSGEPQLELPQNYDQQIENETEANDDTTKEQSDSIEAQVQAPHQKSNVKQYYANGDDDDDEEADGDHGQEASTQQAQLKQEHYEQKASHSTTRKVSTEKTTENTIETEESNTIAIAATVKPKGLSSKEKNIENTIETEESNTIALASTVKPKVLPTVKPKVLPTRAKRIRLKVTKLLSSSTAPKTKIFSTKVTTEKGFALTSTTPMTTPNISPTTSTTTTIKPHTSSKQFVSTSTTESPLKSISRYRSSNKRLTTSTTTTEKPVLKWKPRRKESNGKALTLKTIVQETEVSPLSQKENDNTAKASIREVTKVFPADSPLSTSSASPLPEAVTEKSNDVTTATTSTMSSFTPTESQPSPTTSEAEIYEVLTQKSVSYKIGENGREIPITFNEMENEVKN